MKIAVPTAATAGTRIAINKPMMAITDLKGLLGLVQMSVLEIHVWGSRIADLERPDRLIFDLDPGEGVSWDDIKRGAADAMLLLARLPRPERYPPRPTRGVRPGRMRPLLAMENWPELTAVPVVGNVLACPQVWSGPQLLEKTRLIVNV